MSQLNDPTDTQAAIDLLSAYRTGMDAILNLLEGKNSLNADEDKTVRQMYGSLKDDLGTDRNHLENASRPGQTTHVQETVVLPALHEAHVHLMPATNTNPIRSRWFSAVSDAKVDIDHALSQLKT